MNKSNFGDTLMKVALPVVVIGGTVGLLIYFLSKTFSGLFSGLNTATAGAGNLIGDTANFLDKNIVHALGVDISNTASFVRGAVTKPNPSAWKDSKTTLGIFHTDSKGNIAIF